MSSTYKAFPNVIEKMINVISLQAGVTCVYNIAKQTVILYDKDKIAYASVF
jgi:hypothetical protein